MKFNQLALLFFFLFFFITKAEKIYLLSRNPQPQTQHQSQQQSCYHDSLASKDASRILQTSVLRSTSTKRLDFIKYFQIVWAFLWYLYTESLHISLPMLKIRNRLHCYPITIISQSIAAGLRMCVGLNADWWGVLEDILAGVLMG